MSVNMDNSAYSETNLAKRIALSTNLRTSGDRDSSKLQMTNISKMIKTNDVNRIIGTTTGITEPRVSEPDPLLDEKKEISDNLTNLRKKHDEVKELCLKKEAEIAKMRTENEKMKVVEDMMKNDTLTIHQKLERLQNSFDIQKMKTDEALLTQKTYLHMLDRMKKDRIAFKIKSNNTESNIEAKMFVLHEETEKARQAKQIALQSQDVLDGIMNGVKQEHEKRKETLNQFRNTLKNKLEVEKKRDERIKRTQNIAENAAKENKDANEKKWKELLYIHKFLNFFLKRKMEREMKKYQVVEQAFQKIKAATGLGDAREIVNKFVNREQTYSELLISIADYERKIEGLRKTNDKLKGKIHNLKENNIPVEKSKSELATDKVSEPEINKELNAVNEKYKKAKLVIEKTYVWTTKTLQRLDKVIEKQYKPHRYYMDTYPRENITEAFLKVIDIVNNQLASINFEEAKRVMDYVQRTQIDEEVKREEFIARNVKVKGSPIRNKGKAKDREDSVGGSSRGYSSQNNSFDFMDEGTLENDEGEDINDDDNDLEKMRNEIKLAEARERDILKKKKLADKKDTNGIVENKPQEKPKQ